MDAVRVAARALWRSPGYAACSIALIAAGFAACTSAFSLITAVAWRSPYPAAERLVVPFQTVPRGSGQGADTIPWSYLQSVDLGRRTSVFESTAGFFTMFDETILSGTSTAERVVAQLVSPAYFDLLGAEPAAGRLIAPGDVPSPGTADIAILSHELWTRAFGRSPAVVGQAIRLNGTPFTVSGVANVGFDGLGSGADVWLPFEALPSLSPPMAPLLNDPLAVGGVTVVARLRSGATIDEAGVQAADVAASTGSLMPTPPGGTPGSPWSGGVVQLRRAQIAPELNSFMRLFGLAVAALLLVVCANQASLLLARGKHRSKDAGIRRALGASGWSLARQTLTENLVPVSIGAILGVALSPVLVRAVASRWPEPSFTLVLLRQTDLLQDAPSIVQWPVLAMALVLVVAITIFVSVGQVWKLIHADPASALRRGIDERGATRAPGRRSLVVGQVATATALLCTALLIAQSLTHLLREDTGVQATGVVTATLNLTQAAPDPETRDRLVADLIERLGATPEVEAVALSSCLPLDGTTCSYSQRLRIDGEPASFEGAPPVALQFVSSGYLETLGIHFVRGAPLDATSGDSRPVWIDDTLARRYFGDRSPMGHRLSAGPPDAVVVGVVASVKHGKVDQPPQGTIYYPLNELRSGAPIHLFMRSRSGGTIEAAQVRSVVADVDPDIAMHEFRSFQSVVDEVTASRRFVRDMLVGFAAVAAALAMAGLYALLAYLVAQSTKQIGIRMALGAAPWQIIRPVVVDTTLLVGVGLVIGIALGYSGGGLLGSFLYQVERSAWETYASVATMIIFGAGLAAWLPARLAVRQDPSVAIRHDH